MSYYTKFAPLIISGSKVDAATKLYFDAYSTQPPDAYKEVVNSMVVGMKNLSIWARRDLFYFLDSHSQQGSRINLMTPGTDTLVDIGSGSSWVQYQGRTASSGNALRSVTNIDDLTNISLNDACFGGWWNTSTSTNAYDMGHVTGNRLRFNNRAVTSKLWLLNQTSGSSISTAESSIGHWHVQRTADDDVELFKNGASFSALTTSSSSMPSEPFSIGSAVGQYSDRQIRLAYMGAAIPGLEDEFYDLLAAYVAGVAALAA